MSSPTRPVLWVGVAVLVTIGLGVAIAVTRTGGGESTRSVAMPTGQRSTTTSTTSTTSSTTTTTTTPLPPPTTSAPEPVPPPTPGPGTSGSGDTAAAAPVGPRHRGYSYSVIVDGAVAGSVDELRASAQGVWSDGRGWRAAGIDLYEVPEGGNFVLVLANPAEVPKYSPGTCDTFYSCQSGSFVVINDDRWVNGSPFWPGGLGDYRAMVLNHEVGHWLGRGHQSCGGAGQLAPVMMQQSMGLGECGMNPWPLDWELDALR